ncbi:hypothetical protein H2202_008173 [Exophiala xenobiotica]|nr:hypothetical protein H2202_008173 [Exophiala xenobiotica]
MVSRLTQSLSFHSSPESFISSRLEQLSLSDVDALPTANKIVRAQILDREVHIISGYQACKAILCHQFATSRPDLETTEDESEYANADEYADQTSNDPDPTTQHHPSRTYLVRAKHAPDPTHDGTTQFAARAAYRQFMSDFFPGPNLLLEDGLAHMHHKAEWRSRLHDLPESSVPLIRQITRTQFIDQVVARSGQDPQNTTSIDLYGTLKSLAWDILFGVFLSVKRADHDSKFKQLEDLQEALLRGQFSTFPISISTPFWSSTRSRGVKAVKELEKVLGLLARNMMTSTQDEGEEEELSSACPFSAQCRETGSSEGGQPSVEDLVSHLRLFTSSIANKALASLLTAFLLNLFVWRPSSPGALPTSRSTPSTSVSLAGLIRSYPDPQRRNVMLESVLAETERLSPPVVGVMRRVQCDTLISPTEPGTTADAYTIPAGHDAWLYLSGANRDPDAYDRPGEFVWDRFLSHYSSIPKSGEIDPARPGSIHSQAPLPFAFGDGVKSCLGAAFSRKVCLTVAETLIDDGVEIAGHVNDGGVLAWLGWGRQMSRKEEVQMMARDLKQLPTQRPRRAVKVEVSRNPK